MRFFDAFLSIGRTNGAIDNCPVTEADALAAMQRYDVEAAFIYHTVARDSDPDQGNAAVAALESPLLYPLWAFESSLVREETVPEFLRRALSSGMKGVLVNPLLLRVSLLRSPRLMELAALLAGRRLPLFLAHWHMHPEQDLVDWSGLIDFCRVFPRLPVLLWEWRTRSNRVLFDALEAAGNLKISVSSLWQAQMLDRICHVFGPERLVFSLGLPHLDPGSFQACVRYADIDEEAKKRIAGGNLRQLLDEADYGI